eukprot:gene3107-3403_t
MEVLRGSTIINGGLNHEDALQWMMENVETGSQQGSVLSQDRTSNSTNSYSQDLLHVSTTTNTTRKKRKTREGVDIELTKRVEQINEIRKILYQPSDIDELLGIDLQPRAIPNRAWRRLTMFPRIPKNDFRRNYPTLFVNISNSHDFHAFGSFLRSTSIPNCHMLHYNKQQGLVYELFDIEAMINMFIERMSISPDTCIVLKNAQIKQHLDRGGSEVMFQIQVMATTVRDVLIQVRDEKSQAYTVPTRAYSALLEERRVLARTTPLSQSLPSISLQNWELDLHPTGCNFKGSFICYLDNNNRLYKMEMYHN